jgi:uncharacterized protein DUF4349
MSQRDVLAELRTAQVEAPAQLRARVRLIAAQAPPPRRLTRRRLLLAVPALAAAAAIAAAVVISTRPAGTHVTHGSVFRAEAPKASAIAPAPPRGRVVRYGASLRLRVPSVSDAVKSALHVTAALGGYPVSVHVTTAPHAGTAQLVLRVPRGHVQQAITRLSALGTIVGEQVDIQDKQAGLDATDRTIARLQRQLARLRAEPQTPAVERQTAALTARVVALQRAEAALRRSAHYATVRLALASGTPARNTHYLRDALPWLGGFAVAVLLVLAWRLARRLREDALLSRS